MIRHRLDGSIERSDPLTAPIDSDAALAGLGGRTLIATRLGALLSIEMDGVRLPLSLAPVERRDVAAVWRGDHYLAAWYEMTDVGRAVMGRITPAGQLLDGSGVDLGPASTSPRMASDGRNAVVTWNQGSVFRIAFVTHNGRVAAARDLSAAFSFQPVVHWNGTQYLVVFPWRVAGSTWLAGMRVSAEGVFLDTEPVLILDRPVTPAAIAWDGTEYALAWVEWPGACTRTCRVAFWSISFGPRFLPFGFASKAATVEVETGAAPLSQAAQVAAGEAGFLLVWPQFNPSSLRGLRVSARGIPLDPIAGFEIAAGSGVASSLMRSGDGWTVIRGSETWNIARDGRMTSRTAYPFVPAGSTMSIALGGPAPLVIFRTPTESGSIVRARFIPPARQRAVRR